MFEQTSKRHSGHSKPTKNYSVGEVCQNQDFEISEFENYERS